MTLKWTDQGENISVNRHDTEGITDFERNYIAPWTEESQVQFDEQVAGLPETVHGRVRMLAQDQANFQLGAQVSREDIADAVENVIKDPVAAGSDYQRHQSEPEFEGEHNMWNPTDPSPALVGPTERYHLFPINHMPAGTGTRLVDTLTDMEVDAYPHWPTNGEVQSAIRGWEQERSEREEDLSEPAWTREAVNKLIHYINENPDWNTPDGHDLLMDEAVNRSHVNGNDLVELVDVNDAIDSCN
jgi:hypothetical protein